MAVITEENQSATDYVAPGEYPARIVEIDDMMGVERPTFEDPSVMEKKNVTQFYFAVNDHGTVRTVRTFEMKITGSPKGKLFGFLQKVLGHRPNLKGGWDYKELIGTPVLLTLEDKVSRTGTTYTVISDVSPAKRGQYMDVTAQCPPMDAAPGVQQAPQQVPQQQAPQPVMQQVPQQGVMQSVPPQPQAAPANNTYIAADDEVPF